MEAQRKISQGSTARTRKGTLGAETVRFLMSALLLVASAASAQSPTPEENYPSKPIRWIVPYAAGGITDVLARAVGQKLTESWGKPVVIENRPGGASNIGNEIVARSEPDGYTLLTATPPIATNSALMPDQLRYDPIKDFAPVIELVHIPNAVYVPANSPFHTLGDLIAYARANPGKLTYGSSGIGTVNHLGGEQLKAITKVSIAYVPYKGSAPLGQDLVGGFLPMAVDNLGTHLPLVRTGKIRALAVTQQERVPSVPEVPGMRELGYPGSDAVGWQGVSVRAGTPRPIIDKLAREIDRILKMPDMKARFEPNGNTLVGGTPEQFAQRIRVESDKWQRLIRDLGIKAD